MKPNHSQSRLKPTRVVDPTMLPIPARSLKAVKTSAPAEARPVHDIPRTGEGNGEHQEFGGSEHGAFNKAMMADALSTLYFQGRELEPGHSNPKWWAKADPALIALMEIKPADGIEAMIAAQMIGTHTAAIECFRRAAVPEQTMEARQANLGQANKLTRSFSTLLQALDKHRGKGQQKVVVEHVHVYQGGQAIVGSAALSGARPAVEGSTPGAIEQASERQVTPLIEAMVGGGDRVESGE